MSEEPVRVLVADDHPVYRDGLAALLRTVPGIEVVGTAADGEEAVEPRPSGSSPTSSSWTCRCRAWTGWPRPGG